MPNTDNTKVYHYNINGQKFIVKENDKFKAVKSDTYNYTFDKRTGFFARWGKNQDDDPKFSPIGPEILDIEISINGCPNACPFCYKANKSTPATNMTFETFKAIFDKMPKALTQIAFGITGVKTNPDFLKMMEYTRANGIIPNFTLSGIDLDDDMAQKCAKLVGAVAVSAYQTDKNVCYNTVKKFVDLGIKQTNIHLMVSQETLPFVYEVVKDMKTDERLKGMNAVVFLGVKPKGRAANHYNSLSYKEYADLVQHCMSIGINFGLDSCSAPKFEKCVEQMDISDKKKKELKSCSESCESSIMSAYINVKGEYHHCSFSEDSPKWECIDVLATNDFLKDVWYSLAVIKFRNVLLSNQKNGCRFCPTYPEINI
jgi:hypothetical protein